MDCGCLNCIGGCKAQYSTIAKAIVNHATKPLVSAERRHEIELFVRTIRIVEDAFRCKLRSDTDSTGDLHIIETGSTLPPGYEWSAHLSPSGELTFTEFVLDDEVGIEGKPQ
jgi:hypothetical protein